VQAEPMSVSEYYDIQISGKHDVLIITNNFRMSKAIAICGPGSEFRAERFKSAGLECKAFPLEMQQDTTATLRFMNSLGKADVFVFLFSEGDENREILLCQLSAALAMDKIVVAEIQFSDSAYRNPFVRLDQVIKFPNSAALGQYLMETTC
jgi:hypothetical protein